MDYPAHPLMPTALAALHAPRRDLALLEATFGAIVRAQPDPAQAVTWLRTQPFAGVTIPARVLDALSALLTPPDAASPP